MISWDALLIAGAILILAWVIFYRWRLQEKVYEQADIEEPPKANSKKEDKEPWY